MDNEKIILESLTRNADSVEIGTYQKGGYSRSIKLHRDLSTPEAREKVAKELKEIEDL